MTGIRTAATAFRAATLLACLLFGSPAHAVLDVEDRGPVLDAGNYRMRVTNAGILGNAFYGASRSSDPSFEYPAYSGIEVLNHAELWVGALDEDNEPRVSGGPMLEWRPTRDPDDVVRLARKTDLGRRRNVDDDGDGLVDEERLNGRDDDRDGEVDEDLGLFADQDAGAEFVDDRPEAVNFGYPTGESHRPMGLTAYQVASAWSSPGLQGVSAVTYRVTNHGAKILRDVYMGVMADFDSRRREDRSGHRNDRVVYRSYTASKFEGLSRVTIGGVTVCGSRVCPPVQCFTNLSATVPVILDGVAGSGLPAVTMLGLRHTVDPLTRINPLYGRAPVGVSFRSAIFSGEGIPGQGGVPALDSDRYEAMAGRFPNEAADRATDWVTLLSCGPFRELRPGQSLEFTVAIIAGPNPDEVAGVMPRFALLEHGTRLDLLPNETSRPDSAEWDVGISGVSGHELCLEPPPGVSFVLDQDCETKFDILVRPGANNVAYVPGNCIWTDLDCDFCTGLNGKETEYRWLQPGQVPPAPNLRITPGDRQVLIEWDSQPEVLISSGQVGGPGSRFIAYRLYKLASWRNRGALLPPLENWTLLATFSDSTGNSEVPLADVTDLSVDYDRILFEQKHYPIGRYRFVDREVLNGFDYVYVVTTLYRGAVPTADSPEQGYGFFLLESPLIAKFDDRITPRSESIPGRDRVTVVPNPYKSRAAWDRSPTFGDPLPRHIDFMHLPKAMATIRIYTLAGDFVAQIVHDGRTGDGQAAWDMVSRNGQDIESGIYLFTVESEFGHQVGKFVIVR
ncbi:MAG: hypothetical protein ABIS67_07820 [Candidatus Eisenbacteria bacterium]